MKLTRVVVLALVALALGAAAGCGGSDEAVPEDGVASVDGTVVEKSDLDALMARAKKSYEAQKRDFPKAGSPDYQSLQSQAVAFLVQRVEYDQEAEKLGVEVTDKEVADRVAQVKKQYFGGDEKKFEKQLAEQGYTVEAFVEDVRSQLLSEKLYEEITGEIAVTDAEAQKYYEQNKAQYEVPESRDVRHILIAVKKKDGSTDFEKSKTEADDVYAQLEAGADFATLAKKYSADPGSKDNGGKLTISKGQTVAAFDTTAFLMRANTLSRPIKTEYGYHLIEPLSEVKPGKTTPFAEVKASIKSQLSDTKRNEELTKWAAEVKASYEGKVSYAAGYEPPAAATEPTTTDG